MQRQKPVCSDVRGRGAAAAHPLPLRCGRDTQVPPLGVPEPAVTAGHPRRALAGVGERGPGGVCPLGAAGADVADVAADHVGEGGERQSGDTSLTVPCWRGADVEAYTCSAAANESPWPRREPGVAPPGWHRVFVTALSLGAAPAG